MQQVSTVIRLQGPRGGRPCKGRNGNPIECYYLTNQMSYAIGWVHNRHAAENKSFYVKSGADYENFLGCTAPDSASIALEGFDPAQTYFVTWFPTRTGAVDLPPDTDPENPVALEPDGLLHIDFLPDLFHAIEDNYLDTLHSDYAFVITPVPFVKSLHQLASTDQTVPGWDFDLYPNPAHDMLQLGFVDDEVKDVVLLDVADRRVASFTSVTQQMLQIHVGQYAKGVYWVRVSSTGHQKMKKLILH